MKIRVTAKNYYQSRQGNCAQSVAASWAVKDNKEVAIGDSFSTYGHGKAPGGTCGALYVACSLLGENEESLKNEFIAFSGGYTTCREIRKERKLSCTECVEVAAELLEKYKGV